MPQIKVNDPKRRHLHDFIVIDHDMKPRAAFGTYAEAAAWVVEQTPASAWVINVLHPEGCTCNPLDKPGTRRGIDN